MCHTEHVNLALIIEDHDAERVALLADGKSTTYGDLRRRSAAVRGRLAGLGIGADGRILVACGNEPAFVPAVLGVMGAGAIAIPVNPRSPLPELLSRIELVRPDAVLVGPSMGWLLDHVAEIAAKRRPPASSRPRLRSICATT